MLINKSFSPATIVAGGFSTLTFEIVNPNDSSVGDISVTDNLPTGLEVANPANIISNTCFGEVTAVPGATTITLTGAIVGGMNAVCQFSVNVTGTTAGTYNNVTDPVTTTTINFPNATGSDTASATLNVISPPNATTEVVRPSALNGWGITDFPVSTAAEFAFEDGPATPPIGIGSLEGIIPSASTKLIFARSAAEYSGLPVSGLIGLSFSTYNDALAGSTNDNNWYINLYISTAGDGNYDCRLDYAPTQTADDTWEDFDAFAGSWSGSGAGCAAFSGTLPTFISIYPNATFNAFSNPAEPVIRFNMGDTATGYVGYIGNIDNVRIAHADAGDIT